MSFDQLGLSPELLRAVADEGYLIPTPGPGASHPASCWPAATSWAAPRPAPARPPPSRCPSSSGSRATPTPASRRPAIRCARSIVTPTRELAVQVERELPRLRALRAAAHDRRLRRRAHAAAGTRRCCDGVEILVATPGRLLDHAQPRTVNLEPGRGPRPRRGRPDAGHGLHRRHPADHRLALRSTPEPAVLGHLLDRGPPARRDAAQRPVRGGHRAHGDLRRVGRAGRVPRRRRPQAGAAGAPRPQRDLRQVLVFTRTKHMAGTARLAGSTATASRRPPSTAIAASRSENGRSTAVQAPARSACSSRPMSPRAAWTSRHCRRSSTSSCRSTRRTTSTASAGPDAPARPAMPSRSRRCPTRTTSRPVNRLLKRDLPVREVQGFEPSPGLAPAARCRTARARAVRLAGLAPLPPRADRTTAPVRRLGEASANARTRSARASSSQALQQAAS